MTKPLTIIQARPLIKCLFRDDRIVFKDDPPATFFNEEAEASFYGETWEDVIEEMLKRKYITQNV